jgi:DNA-binding MarR family transcriptional regulator
MTSIIGLMLKSASTRTAPLLQQEAALCILKAAEVIIQDSAETLKPFDLTPAQFNVLRILRGSPDGLACGQISERMVHRDPDVTRLLDRMEARRLITRNRCQHDRRVVTAKISDLGIELLSHVNPAMNAAHIAQFQLLSESQMLQIKSLMEKLLK